MEDLACTYNFHGVHGVAEFLRTTAPFEPVKIITSFVFFQVESTVSWSLDLDKENLDKVAAIWLTTLVAYVCSIIMLF